MTSSDREQFRPRARTDRLVVEPVGDEVLVYDLDADQAHSLSPTAAMVWEAADGLRPVSDLASLLVGLEPGPAVDAVNHILGELAGRDLLVVPPPADVPRLSRRQLMARLGSAGAAILAFPLVDSIVAPVAAQQASCNGTSGSCSSLGPFCCAGLTCVGGFCEEPQGCVNPEFCITDVDDCCPGLVCQSGECVTL